MDRIVAVWNGSHPFKTIEHIADLDPETLKEMESFFKQYNTRRQRVYPARLERFERGPKDDTVSNRIAGIVI